MYGWSINFEVTFVGINVISRLYLHKPETNACKTNYVKTVLPYAVLTCVKNRYKFYRILLLRWNVE